MDNESVLVGCSGCGVKNRVPRERLRESPKCGKCGAVLKPETVFIKCAGCGAKNRIFKALLEDRPRCGKCRAPLPAVPVYDYVVETGDGNFSEEVLGFPGPVLTDFYSNNCGYCHMLVPILQQLASEYAGRLKITKLNIDQSPVTASKYNVMSTPTMILFKDGRTVDTLLGAMQKPEIESRINPHL
ncbi:MAG: thioredoxin domain-containing protein [Pseudomonadota bacterium]